MKSWIVSYKSPTVI